MTASGQGGGLLNRVAADPRIRAIEPESTRGCEALIWTEWGYWCGLSSRTLRSCTRRARWIANVQSALPDEPLCTQHAARDLDEFSLASTDLDCARIARDHLGGAS